MSWWRRIFAPSWQYPRDPGLDETHRRQGEIAARLVALGVEADVRGRGRWSRSH